MSSISSGAELGDVEGLWTIVTMLFETRMESAPVKGKMELASAVSGDEIILDEIVVGETILIVAIGESLFNEDH